MTFQTYRAAVARSFGAPDVLRIEHLPVRPLAPGSIRVAVRVGGVNPVDAAIRSGSFGGSTPFVLGTEFAGVVTKGVSVGDHVVGFGTPASDADLVDTSPGSRRDEAGRPGVGPRRGVGAVGLATPNPAAATTNHDNHE